jgi:hypothetical protein
MRSWVPDWRTYTSYIFSEPTSPHRASGEHDFSHAQLRIQDGKLFIKGAVIDVIARASTPLKSKTFHLQGRADKIYQLWNDVCGQGGCFDLALPYPSCDDQREVSAVLAFTQTLTNGGAATGLRRYDDLRKGENEEDRLAFYRNISDGEWLGQGAAFLTQAFADE